MTTTEEAAGIICYTTTTPAFSAILKHRFSDFLVNEIDGNGKVVRLTDLDAVSPSSPLAEAPAPFQEPSAVQDSTGTQDKEPLKEDSAAAAIALEVASSSAAIPKPDWAEELKGFADILAEDACSAVLGFYQNIASFEAGRAGLLPKHEEGAERDYVRPPRPLRVSVSTDKGQRTRFHELCRQPRLPRVSTQTILEDPEHPSIELTFHYKRNKRKRNEGGAGGGGRSAGTQNVWPTDSPHQFCRFVLYKENMDSAHALGFMTRLLHVSQSCLCVAGTKDKRAVTVQHVTAFKVPPKRLASLNKCMRGMRVGNFELVQEQLHLGDALGNRFEITLRDVVASSLQDVADAAEALKTKGFVNYFGLQRFGAGVNATHHVARVLKGNWKEAVRQLSVGRELIKGNWKEAVRLLMSGHEGERADSAAARRLFLEDGDIAGALKQMPRHLTVERAILEGLRKLPGNFHHALHQVPRNSRHLYVHAYQSFLWNRAATHRVQALGADAAMAGDLVMASGAAADADKEDVDVDVIAETSGKRTTGHLAAVHVVTEDEAAAGVSSIDDVVLPLPGPMISYPEHSTAQVYKDYAVLDGISLESAPHGDKDFSLLGMPGSYRRILHRPADLQWRLLSYREADESLAVTDLQRLEDAPLPSVTHITPESKLEEGARVALQLSLRLPGACYATMLVRELTKTSTATAVHKKLTQRMPAAAAVDPEQS